MVTKFANYFFLSIEKEKKISCCLNWIYNHYKGMHHVFTKRKKKECKTKSEKERKKKMYIFVFQVIFVPCFPINCVASKFCTPIPL